MVHSVTLARTDKIVAKPRTSEGFQQRTCLQVQFIRREPCRTSILHACLRFSPSYKLTQTPIFPTTQLPLTPVTRSDNALPSPGSAYILTILCLIVSLPILVLTIFLTTWATKPTTFYPMILVSATSTGRLQPILAFTAQYNSYGLVLNIIPGAGGTIDAILLIICFFSISFIYLGRRTRCAKASIPSAARGEAPIWLWGITISIIAFSVARSLVGFIGATVGYYTSTHLSLAVHGDIPTSSESRYVSPDGKGFSVGGWACQVKNGIEPSNSYKDSLENVCAQENAARWMTFPLLLVYSILLIVTAMKFGKEQKRKRAVDSEAKREGDTSEID